MLWLGHDQKDCGLIGLEVVADNTRAQKCGFEESGRRTRVLKIDDGTYHDEILMTRILGKR